MKLKLLLKLKVLTFLSGIFFVAASSFALEVRQINGILFSVTGVSHTLKETRFFLALRELKDGKDPFKKLDDTKVVREAGQQLALDIMVLNDLKEVLSVKKEDLEFRKISKEKRTAFEKTLSFFREKESSAFQLMDRHHEAQNLLQKKVATLTPIISSSEIEKYFRNHSEEYVNQPLPQVSNLIAEKLKEERTQNALQDWINSLKQKNQFLFFGDYLR